MSRETLIAALRGGWLVLAFMMLFSRVAFQAMGAERMRSTLTAWTEGTLKRVWGAVCLGFAAVLLLGAISAGAGLGSLDWLLLVVLIAVLTADGLVNVLPAGFETFKDRMQAAWVARHRGTGREGDKHLFGTVNALLAAGALAVIALVIVYRPAEAWAVALAGGIALVLTALLIGDMLRRAGG